MNILEEIEHIKAAGYDPANRLAYLQDGEEREKAIRALIELNEKLASALQGLASISANISLALTGLMDSWWDELAPDVTRIIIPDEAKANILQNIKEHEDHDPE